MTEQNMKKLGFEKDTKLLMIHADDLGLCNSQNMATFHTLENGSVNSVSIMATCPWSKFLIFFQQVDCFL
jgi:chitin disaccharide deacetylase